MDGNRTKVTIPLDVGDKGREGSGNLGVDCGGAIEEPAPRDIAGGTLN